MTKYEKQKAWVNANREHVRAYNRAYLRKWRAENPERERAKVKAYRVAHRDRLNEYARAAQRRRTFGITAAEFAAMLAAQDSRCAICRTDEPGGQGGFHLDHDHAFDAKDRRGHRGLLCHSCNTALGHLNDSAELLRAAADYLEDHQMKHRRLRGA